jgi:RsiW-degrading membrane proteinase PrsW (M82 family)
MEFIAVALSTIVIFGYLVFIWWLDRYEREPFGWVLLCFAWGGIGGTLFGCLLSLMGTGLTMAIIGEEAAATVGTVFWAPVTEELTKALIFAPLVLSRHFDNATDGLIYGAAAGLGFATIENFVYYAGADGNLIQLVVMRTAFSALVHCTSSAMIGMAIGYTRHRGGWRWFVLPPIGYGMAVINHAMWNGMATLSDSIGSLGPFLLGVVVLMGAAVLMFALTQLSLKWEHDAIKRHLLQEAELGLIPREHAQIIPYWLKRSRNGWLPPNIDKNAYVRDATLLAFRQHQLELADGARREGYLEDIAEFRRRIRSLNLTGR